MSKERCIENTAKKKKHGQKSSKPKSKNELTE